MKEPLLSTLSNSAGDNGERLVTSFVKVGGTEVQYPPNTIVTSRYTLFSYLPKSMFEQFRRMANIYFIVLGTIALVATLTNYYLTSVQPEGLLGPVLLVVMISVAKDGYEDMLRHRLDAQVDAQLARQVKFSGRCVETKWKDIEVGNILLLLCDEEVPADVVVLTCGGVQGPTSYVETAAIDGETNLKLRLPAVPDAEGIIPAQDKQSVTGIESFGKIQIRAEAPNASINHFNGSIESPDPSSGRMNQMTLSEKNLLLRGSVIKATEWCVGIVVYTGADSKLALNSKAPPSKVSSIDRIVNKTLLIAIFIFITVCLLSMIFQVIWTALNDDAYYLCIKQNQLDSQLADGGEACNSPAPNEFLSVFTFATLYNNFVCISMYVSLEMVYLCQAYFINNDLNLYDAETDTRAVVHNSSLTADLGQIQYVLSDKTGTLTKNNMRVKRLSIEGIVYGAPISFPGAKAVTASAPGGVWRELKELQLLNAAGTSKGGIGDKYLRILAICNTAMLMPDQITGQVNVTDLKSLLGCLQAESPDEIALVEAAAEHAGVILVNRSANTIRITSKNQSGHAIEEEFELLAVNEFESDRKRMSVLVRIPGEAGSVLLCKGADTSMMPFCNMSKSSSDCLEHIEAFAKTGLRTLVMSERNLNATETKKWMDKFNKASNSIMNRSELLSECAIEIEKNMILLGAVGIEDELQDDVAGAINMIRDAGINMWMITGDKPATAMAIGQLSGLLADYHVVEKVVGLKGQDLEKRLMDLHTMIEQLSVPHLKRTGGVDANPDDLSSRFSEFMHRFLHWLGCVNAEHPMGDGDDDGTDKLSTNKLALVVDGLSLEGIWANARLQRLFTATANRIPTVIASRVSPLQKATLVRMVKRAPGAPVTLAIGDGANDVGMIHEARVGVGISGKEGRHASNAADFAIGQFRFIVPLLIHHGRFNYVRASKLVLYSFFKNLVLVSALFYFCFYSGISGTIYVDSIVLAGFNFYLGLPIIVLGFLDFDITKDEATAYPGLSYAQGRKREELNMYTFARTCIMAFAQGLMIYALTIRFIAGNTTVRAQAGDQPSDRYDIDGIGLNTQHGQGGGLYVAGYTLFSVIVVAMSYKVVAVGSFTSIGAAVWVLSLCGFYLFTFLYNLFLSTGDWYGVVDMALGLRNYWLAICLVPCLIMIIDTLSEKFFSIVTPTSRDKLRRIIDNETKEDEAIFRA